MLSSISEATDTSGVGVFDAAILKQMEVRDGEKRYFLQQGNTPDSTDTRRCVKVLDQGVSRMNYRELAAQFPFLPRDHHVATAKSNITEVMDCITPKKTTTMKEHRCTTRNALDVLKLACARRLGLGVEAAKLELQGLVDRVKERFGSVVVVLSGDGHRISSTRSHTLFTLRLLCGKQDWDCCSPFSHHPIIIYEGPENTQNMAKAWDECDGAELVHYCRSAGDGVALRFCSDWKFESLFLARKGATSNSGCTYCNWCLRNVGERDGLHGTQDEWPQEGDDARVGEPVADLTPSEVVPDPFHCFLRISQRLFALFIGREVSPQFSEEVGRRIELEMEGCGIHGFYLSVAKDNTKGDLAYPSLNGVQCDLFFDGVASGKFDLRKFIASEDRIAMMKTLWKKFHDLSKSIRSRSEIDVDEFEKECIEWIKLFLYAPPVPPGGRFSPEFRRDLCMYTRHEITPYMHKMVSHFPSIIRRIGPLGFYSCESLEARNKLHHRRFQHGQKCAESTSTIMEWGMRQEEFAMNHNVDEIHHSHHIYRSRSIHE